MHNELGRGPMSPRAIPLRFHFGVMSPYHPVLSPGTLQSHLGRCIEFRNRVVDTGRLTEQQYQQVVGEEARTLTFAELKALIEQGKTDGIPNNKLIPDTINVSPPLQALIPALDLRYHRTLPQREYRKNQKETLGNVTTCSFLTVIYKTASVV